MATATRKKQGNGKPEGALETLGPVVTNDAAWTISTEQPYEVEVTIKGVVPLIFHRWSVESIEDKAKAAKGSKAKKEDDVESYVYRDERGYICLPGEYLRMSIVNAAKSKQDPRSPRKSAMDMFKAGITIGEELCSLGSKDWDYLDRRRVMVQRNGITRSRPAFNAGWEASFTILVLVPEYIAPAFLLDVMTSAGKLVGIADFRPTYGRYQVTSFKMKAV